MTAALRTAVVALVALAVAAPAEAQPTAAPAKAKHCRKGYHRVTVHRKLRRHGHVVRRHGHAVIVKRRVCRKKHHATTPTPTQTVAPTPVRPRVTVELDGVTQAPSSPFEATYDATATSDAGPGTLPGGIVNTYEDGLLKCSEQVGGADDTTACPTTTTVGPHEIVLNYISDTLTGLTSTQTTTTTVQPFSTTAAVSYARTWHPEGGAACNGLYWEIVPAIAVKDQNGNTIATKPDYDPATDFKVYDLTTGALLASGAYNFALCSDPNGHDMRTVGATEIPMDHAIGMTAVYRGSTGYSGSESAPVTLSPDRPPAP